MHILITDNGNHAPEKWAAVTVGMIFPIDTVPSDKLIEAKRKEIELIEVLTKHHNWHSEDEKQKLAKNPKHIFAPLDNDAKAMTSEIVGLMQNSPWADHFAKPEVQDAVEQVIKSHTATNRYTERSWHSDRNYKTCNYAHKFRELK